VFVKHIHFFITSNMIAKEGGVVGSWNTGTRIKDKFHSVRGIRRPIAFEGSSSRTAS